MKKHKTITKLNYLLEDSRLNELSEKGWSLTHFSHANSHEDVYTYIFTKDK